MLLIGDIHANATQTTAVLTQLRQYCATRDDEQSVIFLGDYVYHFSYHRQSMLELVRFFLELAQAGRYVYVLAGNHDRLGDTFVFAEAQSVLQSLVPFFSEEEGWEGGQDKLAQRKKKSQTMTDGQAGFVRFITTPELHQIDGEQVLFMPSMLDDRRFTTVETQNFASLQPQPQLKSQQQPPQTKYERLAQAIVGYIADIAETHCNASQQGNASLLVLHHYYIADTQFPGQKAIFRERDGALSARVFDIPGVRLISGHLHQPFVYRNYCCVGSVWHTSPLETNQYKCLRRYNDGMLEPSYVHINPYITITPQQGVVTTEQIQQTLEEVHERTNANLTPGPSLKERGDNMGSSPSLKDPDISRAGRDLGGGFAFSLLSPDRILPDISQCTLHLVTDTSYQDVDSLLASDVRQSCRDVQIKRSSRAVADLVSQLATQGKQLGSSLEDRKTLLKTHLQIKFGMRYEQYISMLQELRLL